MIRCIYFLSAIAIFLPQSVVASPLFNPNYIISNEDLSDYTSMNLTDIYNFLHSKNSTLPTKFFSDYKGYKRTAPFIIHQAALENEISPKVILTMLQKEQSLIENTEPTKEQFDWATGYGVCDSCTHNDFEIQEFKGFGKQVNFLTKIMRKYNNRSSDYTFQVGKSISVDSQLLTPLNQATANLFNYTPHIEGNRSFWKLWNKYFEQVYPDGSVLQTQNSKDIWYLDKGKRRNIESMAVLLSYFDPRQVLEVTNEELEKYDRGAPLKFPNYSLLRTPNGRIYLLVDEKLRYITSPQVFKTIGFHPDEVLYVTYDEISSFEIGENIDITTAYPTGALLQDNRTGGVYFVQNGMKHPIYSREILYARYPNREISPVDRSELGQFTDGPAVLFAEGELIKGTHHPTVYVISQSKRRPFLTEEIFKELGYRWDNVIITDSKSVEIHLLGEIIQ